MVISGSISKLKLDGVVGTLFFEEMRQNTLGPLKCALAMKDHSKDNVKNKRYISVPI